MEQSEILGAGTEKREGKTEILKRGSKLDQGMGALKGRGAGTSL